MCVLLIPQIHLLVYALFIKLPESEFQKWALLKIYLSIYLRDRKRGVYRIRASLFSPLGKFCLPPFGNTFRLRQSRDSWSNAINGIISDFWVSPPPFPRATSTKRRKPIYFSPKSTNAWLWRRWGTCLSSLKRRVDKIHYGLHTYLNGDFISSS